MNTLLQKMLCVAVFAALICAGWMIAIPIGPIPLVLQNALAVLSGLVLGPVYGGLSVLLFLLLGMLGLPVFSGGRGGIAVFAGPTAGFLAGYVLAALIAGLIAHSIQQQETGSRFRLYAGTAAASVIGFLSIYVLGIPWFKHILSLTWQHALLKGFVPFIVPDLIKAVLIVPAAVKLLPIVRRYLR